MYVLCRSTVDSEPFLIVSNTFKKKIIIIHQSILMLHGWLLFFFHQSICTTGPVSFSTEADLIAPGVSLHGTFSITPDEFYFEVNEHHESFTKADQKVSFVI